MNFVDFKQEGSVLFDKKDMTDPVPYYFYYFHTDKLHLVGFKITFSVVYIKTKGTYCRFTNRILETEFK